MVGEIVDEPEQWQAKEAWWAAEAERLFAAHTERWPDSAKERHRRLLDDLSCIPGLPYQVRMELKLEPEEVS